MTILQPGQHWEGLEIVGNDRFKSRTRRAEPTREELFFSKAVYAAEMCQRQGWNVSPDTMQMVNPDLRQSDLTELLRTDKFLNALKARGIPLSATAGLTPQQLGAIAVFMDMSTPANLTQKLRMAGVTKAEWDGWMRQPAFAARLSELSEDAIAGSTATALQRVAQAVDQGAPWAIQLVLAMNKRYDPRSEAVDPMVAIRQILNVLDEELDEATLQRINDRMGSLTGRANPAPPGVLRIEAAADTAATLAGDEQES